MSSKKITGYSRDFKLKVLEYYFKHGGDKKFGLKTKTAHHFCIDHKTVSRMLCKPDIVQKARRILTKKSSSDCKSPTLRSEEQSYDEPTNNLSETVEEDLPQISPPGPSRSSHLSDNRTMPSVDSEVPVIELPEDPDFSLLKRTIESSASSSANFARLLITGTNEVKRIMVNECELIFECRVCRNLFRSVVNFLAHKRVYCQEEFANVKSLFHKDSGLKMTNESSTVIVEPEPPPCDMEETGSETQQGKSELIIDQIASRLARNKKKESGENTDGVSSSIHKGSSSYFNRLQEVNGNRKSMNNNCSVLLQDIAGVNTAVYQTFIPPISSKPPRERPQRAVREVHQRKREQPVQLDSEGKVVKRKEMKLAPSPSITSPVKEVKEPEERIFMCRSCPSSFSSQILLNSHVEEIHGIERCVYTCPICNMIFLTIWGCVKHLIRVHKKKKHQRERLKHVICSRAYSKVFTRKDMAKLTHKSYSSTLQKKEVTSSSPVPPKEAVKEGLTSRLNLPQEEDAPPTFNKNKGLRNRNHAQWECNVCSRKFLSKSACLAHQSSHVMNHADLAGVNKVTEPPRQLTLAQGSPISTLNVSESCPSTPSKRELKDVDNNPVKEKVSRRKLRSEKCCEKSSESESDPSLPLCIDTDSNKNNSNDNEHIRLDALISSPQSSDSDDIPLSEYTKLKKDSIDDSVMEKKSIDGSVIEKSLTLEEVSVKDDQIKCSTNLEVGTSTKVAVNNQNMGVRGSESLVRADIGCSYLRQVQFEKRFGGSERDFLFDRSRLNIVSSSANTIENPGSNELEHSDPELIEETLKLEYLEDLSSIPSLVVSFSPVHVKEEIEVESSLVIDCLPEEEEEMNLCLSSPLHDNENHASLESVNEFENIENYRNNLNLSTEPEYCTLPHSPQCELDLPTKDESNAVSSEGMQESSPVSESEGKIPVLVIKKKNLSSKNDPSGGWLVSQEAKPERKSLDNSPLKIDDEEKDLTGSQLQQSVTSDSASKEQEDVMNSSLTLTFKRIDAASTKKRKTPQFKCTALRKDKILEENQSSSVGCKYETIHLKNDDTIENTSDVLLHLNELESDVTCHIPAASSENSFEEEVMLSPTSPSLKRNCLRSPPLISQETNSYIDNLENTSNSDVKYSKDIEDDDESELTVKIYPKVSYTGKPRKRSRSCEKPHYSYLVRNVLKKTEASGPSASSLNSSTTTNIDDVEPCIPSTSKGHLFTASSSAKADPRSTFEDVTVTEWDLQSNVSFGKLSFDEASFMPSEPLLFPNKRCKTKSLHEILSRKWR